MVIFVLWPCFSSILCFHVVSPCVRYNHPHTPLATSTTSKGTIRLRCPTCGTKRGTWHLYCTCWWYSLCNLEYWSKYTNTFSYNLGCWIDPSKFFSSFSCMFDITTTIYSLVVSSMFDQVQGACLEIGGTRGMHALPKCVVSTIGERHGWVGHRVSVFVICLTKYFWNIQRFIYWFNGVLVVFFQKYSFRYHGVSVQLEKPRRKRYGRVCMLDAFPFDWLQLVRVPIYMCTGRACIWKWC